MGLPLPHGKLAMWLFLVTEIMFFTGLIGTYILLRNGTPTRLEPWPAPHDVHLIEWVGAFNTFVLICSSLTIVLAHYALGKGDTRRAVLYLVVTLALGGVFLVVKAFEYNSKFSHGILPGRVYEKLDGPDGPKYLRHVEEQLKHIVEHPEKSAGVSAASAKAWEEFLASAKKLREASSAEKGKAENAMKEAEASATTAATDLEAAKKEKDQKAIDVALSKQKDATAKWEQAKAQAEKQKTEEDASLAKRLESDRKTLVEKHKDLAPVADSWFLLEELPTLSPRQVNLRIAGSKYVNQKPILKEGLPKKGDPDKVVENPLKEDVAETKGLLEQYPDLHLSYAIPYGNMWSSCYFAMTGFHALHVFGGLVIFVILLLMALGGRMTTRHEGTLELTGLYWHFVDIVWIFLFPLLYLV
jgi:cytochrome c oxidase subunit 3